MNSIPERPTQRPEAPQPSRSRGCLAMLVVGLIAVALIVGLALISPNYALAFVLIFGAAFALPLFHYVVWGWWLGGMIRRDAEEEEQNHRAP